MNGPTLDREVTDDRDLGIREHLARGRSSASGWSGGLNKLHIVCIYSTVEEMIDPASGETSSAVRIESALGELLRVASSQKLHEARLLATGSTISIAEFRFLRRIAEQGQVSVSEASIALGVSQPTASRTLRQLEANGMVSRASVASDGRRALYRITAAGRRVQRRLERHMHQQLEDALGDVPTERRNDMAALLEELVARLHDGGRMTDAAPDDRERSTT